nr:xylulose kinase-1 [Tanacetum cinerariifolium]
MIQPEPTKTKKVQKTLLKQQYKNFTGSSSESLDQIHDRLQKLTHTLIWRNKTDLEEQSLDDLFNSPKIYEAEVKHSSSTGTTIQNLTFVSFSNTDSTTEPVSVDASVFAVCAKMHVSSLFNVDSLRDGSKMTDGHVVGNYKISLSVVPAEHVVVQRETKARTLLLQSLPKDHMADFHHLDDAREIWLAVKARFGGNEESKKMRKTMLKQEFSEFGVSEEEGLYKGYDRFQKILSQLNQMQAKPDNDDVDQLEMEDLDIKWQMAMLSLRINKFQKKAGRKINFNNKDSARFDRRKARCYNYHAGNAAGSVYNVAVEFAMMGISPKVCDLSTPSVFDPEPENREVKSLYERFVKVGRMHEVPPPITGTFMPTSYKSDLKKTQATFGLKSNTSSINIFDSNDFVSCDNSDKSSASEMYNFASCVSSPKTNDSFSTVDVKILPESDVKDPCPTNGFPSCSFKENVKPLRNLCNKSGKADRIHCKNIFVHTKKCFVCDSKSHLIKDCDVYDTVDNFSSVISKAASIPTGSRNSSASTSAGRSIPTASRLDDFFSGQKEILVKMDLPLWVLICPRWSVTTATRRDILQDEEPANYALMAFSSSSSSSDNETGIFLPPKPDLVFNTAPNGVQTDHFDFLVKLSPTKPDQDLSHTIRPSAPIIEDWVSDFEDESETKALQIISSFVQPPEQVKSPRPSIQHVETSIPVATPKPASPKPTDNGKRNY